MGVAAGTRQAVSTEAGESSFGSRVSKPPAPGISRCLQPSGLRPPNPVSPQANRDHFKCVPAAPGSSAPQTGSQRAWPPAAGWTAAGGRGGGAGSAGCEEGRLCSRRVGSPSKQSTTGTLQQRLARLLQGHLAGYYNSSSVSLCRPPPIGAFGLQRTHLFERHLAGVKLLQLLLVLAEDGGQVLRQRLRLRSKRQSTRVSPQVRSEGTPLRGTSPGSRCAARAPGRGAATHPRPCHRTPAPLLLHARPLWCPCTQDVLDTRAQCGATDHCRHPTCMRVRPSDSSCRVCTHRWSGHGKRILSCRSRYRAPAAAAAGLPQHPPAAPSSAGNQTLSFARHHRVPPPTPPQGKPSPASVPWLACRPEAAYQTALAAWQAQPAPGTQTAAAQTAAAPAAALAAHSAGPLAAAAAARCGCPLAGTPPAAADLLCCCSIAAPRSLLMASCTAAAPAPCAGPPRWRRRQRSNTAVQRWPPSLP